MVDRSIIKCPVCQSNILVRTQVGYLIQHPIRIHCGQCGILISGLFSQDKTIPQFGITYDNAEVVEPNSEINYCIEVSGEFLTDKIKKYDSVNDAVMFSPFMKAVSSLDDNIDNFRKDLSGFLRLVQDEWPQFRQMNDLWLSGNYQYLREQLRRFLPKKQFPLNNDLELLRGLHIMQANLFNPVFQGKYFKILEDGKMFADIQEIMDKDIQKYFELVEYFSSNNMLDNFERDIFKIVRAFIQNYKYLIVSLSLEYYSDVPNLDVVGTATVTFDDIKYFFQDCFECIGALSPLATAYNNLKYRNSFSEMPILSDPSLAKVKTIDDLLKQTKSNRLKYCLSDESFNKLIVLNYSSELRNVIGHLECFQYDGSCQRITYYPSCRVGKGEKKSIYLVEFLSLALKQFRTVLLLNELVYQTKKNNYAMQGQRPVSPDVFC